MVVRSAGVLLFRRGADGLEVLLGHMGGPLWARKDEGAWSIPKGELEPGEDPRARALLELHEETGTPLPPGTPLVDLGAVRLKSGKTVTAYAAEGDLDADAIVSNTFELEWPPRSGRTQAFPEVDRAGWFDLEQAQVKLLAGQLPLLEALAAHLAAADGPRS